MSEEPDAPDAPDASSVAEAVPSAEPLDAALREIRPAHEDLDAALARARVAARLFGAADPVRIGRYEVEARVGAGGGGEVYVARDPELSRRVAVKLLRGGGADRDRLLAEGQALARLSHPNIVPVYDAGAFGDQVYVVMELVDGDTLRAFCAAPARSVRDIVRAYRQAAEGLAAAHRAGFIHRDFKPDNAVVGKDGRVRVVDFGLARGALDAVGPVDAGDSPVHVTHAGLGTPRYMAPEQAGAAVLTPAADQYAFCASLREGVLARGRAVPRWLEPILRRGMADDPAARFPSMAVIHAALGRDPSWRWRRRGAAFGAIAIAGVAFGAGRTDRDPRASCETTSAELISAWNPAVDVAVQAHFRTLATPYARQAEPIVRSALTEYATTWRGARVATCEKQRRGQLSDTQLDRRGSCLAGAKAALASAAGIIITTTTRQLPDAVKAISELPDLKRCDDDEALTTNVTPPSLGLAGAVATLSDELAALEIEVRAARKGVRPRVDAVVAKARALQYAPLLARALRLMGRAAIAVDARAAAIAPLDEGAKLALAANDDTLAVECYARKLYALGKRGAASEALESTSIIKAIAERLPRHDDNVRVVLENSLGVVAIASGQRAVGRAAYERALQLAQTLGGVARLEAVDVWANTARAIDDPLRRRSLLREAIEIASTGFGATHPVTLSTMISAGLIERNSGTAIDALTGACSALTDLHPDYTADILDCQYELARLAYEHGDQRTAARAFRAVSQRGQPGTRKVELALAHLEALENRSDEAATRLRAFDEWLSRVSSLDWWHYSEAADLLTLKAQLAITAGRGDTVRTLLRDAITLLDVAAENLLTPAHTRRRAFAQALLAQSWKGQPLSDDDRVEAEAALAWYRIAGGDPELVALLTRALQ